ncbi:MAG: ASKHA domain-containing protein [Oscillospiraceae bacterium]
MDCTMAVVTIKYRETTEQHTVLCGTALSAVLLRHEGCPHLFCGGKGTCGKCRVTAHGMLSKASAEELRLLSAKEIAEGVRLACRCTVLGDCEVLLHNTIALQNISVTGCMPKFPVKPTFTHYGAAVDLGTTTLVAQLYNSVGLLCTVSTQNPQSNFGADVISRIGKSLEGFHEALAVSVGEAISAMLENLEEQAKLPPKSIDGMVITGNTAMLYLLTEKNPDCLAHAPFVADDLFGRSIPCETLSLPCKAGAQVYLPRCMSAFVGADITGAILAGGLCTGTLPRLLVDIGTNGEMALWHNGQLFCCSTAAGPTFEGAGISMGMQGANGAIDHVAVRNGKPCVHTIGESAALGICGSGIVDTIFALLELGIIDETGFLEGDIFSLTEKVKIVQQDVRMVQLAKSAICAGIHTLLQVAGVPLETLSALLIAGGFGSYLDLDKAAGIGLFPTEIRKNALVLGNAALSGAAMMLMNPEFREASEQLANSAKTIDLTTNSFFSEYYVEGMFF